MGMSRVVVLVAAAGFATSPMIAAQGRGQGSSRPVTQLARGVNGGPNAGTGGVATGSASKAGATPGKSGGSGKAGTPRGASADAGKNAGGVGRGNTDGGGGDQPRENAGSGRGVSGVKNDSSFIARMNPQSRARLEAMLPAGVTLEQAAEGFRNRGQFVAALQQSHNQNISFVDLKAEMTGDNPRSLGEALRKLGVANDED
jgi:hypothetical protein